MTDRYSPEDLEHHLGYEIEALNGCYELILEIEIILEKGGANEQQRRHALNAMMESYCLHGRALLEFFSKSRETTNSAADFAVPSYKSDEPPKNLVVKLNRQISHVIYNRPKIDRDKIQGKDRDKILRWLAREIQRWDGMREASYSAIVIPSVNTSLIPPKT